MTEQILKYSRNLCPKEYESKSVKSSYISYLGRLTRKRKVRGIKGKGLDVCLRVLNPPVLGV